MQFYSKVTDRPISTWQLNWISTYFQLFITDFAKIIRSFFGSNSRFQETPQNDCFRNNSFTRVAVAAGGARIVFEEAFL